MSETQASIQRLIERAQAGDHDAFTSLYQHYYNRIFKAYLGNVNEWVAEDLTSEVFCRAWQRIGSYKPQEGKYFYNWLGMIARNVWLDHSRRSYVRKEISVDNFADDSLGLADNAEPLTDLLEYALEKLPDALLALTERQRVLLRSKYWDEQTDAATAADHGLPRGAIKTALYRAKQSVHRLIMAEIARDKRS